ncbi:hypothetical protein [Pseudoalteromonas phage KB12-38]|nr:hypothetical protein [Pseudoalteromonas phage KB12-38]
MKHYVVTLRLYLGSYEKHVRHLVSAEDTDKAHEAALSGESHNDDAGYNSEGEWWDGWDMFYRVVDCEEVTPEEFTILNKYL